MFRHGDLNSVLKVSKHRTRELLTSVTSIFEGQARLGEKRKGEKKPRQARSSTKRTQLISSQLKSKPKPKGLYIKSIVVVVWYVLYPLCDRGDNIKWYKINWRTRIYSKLCV